MSVVSLGGRATLEMNGGTEYGGSTMGGGPAWHQPLAGRAEAWVASGSQGDAENPLLARITDPVADFVVDVLAALGRQVDLVEEDGLAEPSVAAADLYLAAPGALSCRLRPPIEVEGPSYPLSGLPALKLLEHGYLLLQHRDLPLLELHEVVPLLLAKEVQLLVNLPYFHLGLQVNLVVVLCP